MEYLIEQARRVFAGQRPDEVGAALADLLATWLAGHVVENDDRNEQIATWAALLTLHLSSVRRLTDVHAAEIRKRHGIGAKQGDPWEPR